MPIPKVMELEKKIIRKICELPSFFLCVLFLIFTLLFFQMLTFKVGESLENFIKVDGTLEDFQCLKKFTGSDTIYLKTSLSKIESRFYGYKKCHSLGAANALGGQKLNYKVTFYVKHQSLGNVDGSIGIYAIDYNGSEFLHPEGGLGEEEIFNFYSLLMLFSAFGIAKILYSRWKSDTAPIE
jgi:hypothetical protein